MQCLKSHQCHRSWGKGPCVLAAATEEPQSQIGRHASLRTPRPAPSEFLTSRNIRKTYVGYSREAEETRTTNENGGRGVAVQGLRTKQSEGQEDSLCVRISLRCESNNGTYDVTQHESQWSFRETEEEMKVALPTTRRALFLLRASGLREKVGLCTLNRNRLSKSRGSSSGRASVCNGYIARDH